MAWLQTSTVEIDADAESVRIIGCNCPPDLEVEIHLSRRYRASNGKAGPNIPYTDLRLSKYHTRLNLGRISSFLHDPGRYKVAAVQLLSTAPLSDRERSFLKERVVELLCQAVPSAAGAPVRTKIVADVRTTRWTDPASLEERDDTCAVCLESFLQDNNDTIRMACSHKFHADCIQQCMDSTQSTCPLCRSVIGWCVLKDL